MKRKTEYDLIAVYKGDLLINMDSQAPNQAALEWMREKEAKRTFFGKCWNSNECTERSYPRGFPV